MSYYTDLYKQKLTTADEAVKDVKSNDRIDIGFNVGTVHDLDAALARKVVNDNLHNVMIRDAILVEMPELYKIPDAKDHIVVNSWFYSPADRAVMDKGFIINTPERFSEIPRYISENTGEYDYAMCMVGPMDEHGCFNFGPSAAFAYAATHNAKHVIVEVNDKLPNCLGGWNNYISIDEVDAVVEMQDPYVRCLPPSKPATEVDKIIANTIVEQIPDGACLQLGIGGMPNTVGALLADSDLKDLGVHTEMYVDAFVKLAEKGIITNRKKTLNPGRQVYGFASGSQFMFDYINNNPQCMIAPIDYVNDAFVIAQHDNMMSINNIVDIDFFGQVNGESSGIRQISGSGGQLDYVLGAYLSKGGKSFLCCSSTFTDKKGVKHSRIVPTLKPGSTCTDCRANTQYVVTEYGMVNLKGASLCERAERLISIAHPDFRDELIKEADKMGLWRPSNRR